MTFIPPQNSRGYVALPVLVDPNALVKQAFANIVAQFPGWIPREGHLEVAELEESAQMMSVSAQVASQMSSVIFQSYGQLVGVLPIQGVSATAACLFTMVDTAGYVIPSGTVVSYAVSGSSQLLFTVRNTITVAPGGTTGTGTLIAELAGAFANGLVAAACQMVVTMASVSSVATTTTSAGGVDPETQVAYLNRLTNELQLLAPRPILPADFAAMAQNVAGVYRALAIDGLNPGRVVTDGVTTNASPSVSSATAAFTTALDLHRPISGANIPASSYIGVVTSGTAIGLSSSATANVPVNATAGATGVTLTLGDVTGQERFVTVCGLDSTGAGLSPTVTGKLQTYLNGLREVNFVVGTITPTTTSIDVTVTCDAVHGANTTTVQSAIHAALTAFLNPANWAGGNLTPPGWDGTLNEVRFLDIANVIHDTFGVLYIPSGSLTLNIHSNSPGVIDIALPGDAPLPTAGTLSITVNAT